MRKILITLMLVVACVTSVSAGETATVVVPTQAKETNYVLYPTSNMYTFLKLDTRTGKLWQVQYSLENDEFECVLNDKPLASAGRVGQFALYPTQNMWTFLLLDTVNGKVWHVQWSQDKPQRMVVPIKLYKEL